MDPITAFVNLATELTKLITVAMEGQTPEQRATARMFGPIFAAGHGYGMGVAVVMEPEQADVLRCRGGVGTIGWPGAYGSWWQADPNDGSVLVFLSQHMVELPQMAQGIGLATWAVWHAHAHPDRDTHAVRAGHPPAYLERPSIPCPRLR